VRHLITDAMLDSAAGALTGHGARPDSADGCLCGHDATPVSRHVAELVADAIEPSLTQEVMALLFDVMATSQRTGQEDERGDAVRGLRGKLFGLHRSDGAR